MTTLLDTLFLADVIAIAVCMHLIAKCIADDSEKRRLKRREKYRQRAYAEVYRRRMQSENRNDLWEGLCRK